MPLFDILCYLVIHIINTILHSHYSLLLWESISFPFPIPVVYLDNTEKFSGSLKEEPQAMTPLTLYHKNKIEYVNVPCDFIDHYLMDAPGEFVKIYLYLLRCMKSVDNSPSLSDVADKLNFTEKDVLRALKYWEKKKLLSLVYNSEKQLCGINFDNITGPAENNAPLEDKVSISDAGSADNRLADSAPTDTKAASASPAFPDTAQPPLPKKRYSKAKLAALSGKPDTKQMLFIAEQYLGTSFNPSEMETLLYIYDGLGFSLDLIEYLLGVCVEKQLTSLAHIEEVAIDWFQKGITTVNDAKKANTSQRKYCQAVCKALGIEGRTLAEIEQMFLLKWSGTYGFSLDFILEACHRTIQSTGKPSFSYIDTILKNWQEAGVKTMADVQALDMAHQAAQTRPKKLAAKTSAAPKGKGNSFPERSYDYSALEQQLLKI